MIYQGNHLDLVYKWAIGDMGIPSWRVLGMTYTSYTAGNLPSYSRII